MKIYYNIQSDGLKTMVGKSLYDENTAVFYKMQKAIVEFGMLECSSLLVGFSGGADSCAMLDVLHKMCKTKDIKLYALHVNHMIRGNEANRDELFCFNFCKERSIHLTIIKKDIPALAKEQGKGLEECARDFRYLSFSEFCTKNKIERIATAHNANDNTETVLFNLARGSGLRGLCGIPPVRDNIIRPLIYCKKEEIIEYCNKKGIEYMQDSTNSSIEYTRNYIRHELTPCLEHINNNAISAISRNSSILRKDLDALETIADSCLDYSDCQLAKMPESIIVRVLQKRYKKAGFDPSCLEEKHISAILKLLKKGKTGDTVSLPNKSRVLKLREGLEFSQEERTPAKKNNDIFKLCYGINNIPQLNCSILIRKPNEIFEKFENVYKMSMKAEIIFDTIDSLCSLYCRAKSDGDSYRFGGMTRSVRKLLWQKGIPAEKRINYPVICDDKGILLLPGFPLREGCNIQNGEKYIIEIYLFKN